MGKKFVDIMLPHKGLLDLIPGNKANKEYTPNMQNFEVDEGVLKTRKGYIVNSNADVNPYNTGTIAMTKNSATVVGIGTLFSANVSAGLALTNFEHPERHYRIASVDSDIQLTLEEVFADDTTFQGLTASNNYNCAFNGYGIVYDGTNWWHISTDGTDSELIKWDANPALGNAVIESFTGYYMTGITYMDGRIWLSGQRVGSQYIYKMKANPADGIDVEYNMGNLTTSTTPLIMDISNIGTTLYSYAGFWVSAYEYTEWVVLKHDADIVNFTEYSQPSTYQEFGLANDGTNLYGRCLKVIDGVLKDCIVKMLPDSDALAMDTIAQYDPDIEHDEGAETYIVGVGWKAATSEIWVCRNDSGTLKLTQYSSTTTGDSYAITGVTDNLFNFRKWDATEQLVWSTIPKGMVAYSKNIKDWYIMKTALNTNYHINFVSFMNYMFAANGIDTPWCWNGSDKVDGECTGDGNVGGTTVVDASFTEADDYWNGCSIVMTTGNNAGEIREISDWDNGTNTFTVSVAFSNQTLTGDDFYVVYTVDDPNEIDGSGVISHNAAVTSMPTGQILAAHQDRLWITDKDSPALVRCSGLFMQVDDGMDDTWDELQVLQISRDDSITGLYPAGDYMYVFGEKRTYVLTGGPSFSSYQMIPLKEPVGLLSDRGAQVHKNFAIFCSREGIFKVLGREMRELTEGIPKLFKTIQQTKLYHARWAQSSQTEFDSGTYDSNKLLTELGRIILKPYATRWASTAEWNTKVDGANIGTSDDNVSLLQYENEEGVIIDTSYLSGNIAGSYVPAMYCRYINGGTPANTVDGNNNTLCGLEQYSSGGECYAVQMWGPWKDLRKFRIKFSIWNGGSASSQNVTFKIGTRAVGFNYSDQYTEVINCPRVTETHKDITVNISSTLANSVKWSFNSGTGTIFRIYELEIYEWITAYEYQSTYPYYDEGYVVMQLDTGVSNPLWLGINADVSLNSCTYQLKARVSSDGATWDDWQNFSTGDTPPVARKRYIQIGCWIYTDVSGSGDNHTPTLNSLSVDYYKYITATYTSPAQNLTDEMSAWDIFDVDINVPTGSSVKFEVTSADTEAHLGNADYPWVEITPGTKPTGYFDTSGDTWFQWRVTLYLSYVTAVQDLYGSGSSVLEYTPGPEVSAVYIWWFEGGQQVTPICSVFYDHKYHLSGAIQNADGEASKHNNMVLVFNKEEAFEKMIGLNTSGMVEFKSRLYAGASDCGFIYLLEEGYNDNGKEIECFIETMDYDYSKDFRKDLRNKYKNLLKIYCEGKITGGTFYVSYSFDKGTTWIDVPIDLDDLKHYEVSGDIFSVEKCIAFGASGKMIRYRIYAKTTKYPVEIHRLDAEIEPTELMGA